MNQANRDGFITSRFKIPKYLIEKRERLGNQTKEVDVTIATIGDSRTGKSEMAEKMEGVLSMSLI